MESVWYITCSHAKPLAVFESNFGGFNEKLLKGFHLTFLHI
jgi:hypothetical protein